MILFLYGVPLSSKCHRTHRFARRHAGGAHERVHTRERQHARLLVARRCILQLVREREERVLSARGETARVEL